MEDIDIYTVTQGEAITGTDYYKVGPESRVYDAGKRDVPITAYCPHCSGNSQKDRFGNISRVAKSEQDFQFGLVLDKETKKLKCQNCKADFGLAAAARLKSTKVKAEQEERRQKSVQTVSIKGVIPVEDMWGIPLDEFKRGGKATANTSKKLVFRRDGQLNAITWSMLRNDVSQIEVDGEIYAAVPKRLWERI